MRLPLVSVVIPAYNRAVVISRAVRSVQNQTFHDLEIVVVDDGSKDNTAEIGAELASADPRIRYVTHSTNKGSQAARNTGARAAKGEWVAFLDSDDEFLPNSLEIRLSEAENCNVKIVHSECFIDYTDSGERTLYGVRPLAGSIYKYLLAEPGPMFQALLVHNSALKEIHYLDETIVSHQEWDTTIMLAKNHEFGFVPEPTFVYHRRPSGTISSNLIRSAQGYEQIVLKNMADIQRLTSRRTLARHYEGIAGLYDKCKEKNLAKKYSSLAIRTYPSIHQMVKLIKLHF